MTTFQWGAATHAGRVRPSNQDAVYANHGLFIVADGMGGHNAGETASRIAVEVISNGHYESAAELSEAVIDANAEILSTANNRPDLQGMGTTLCAMALVDSNPPTAVLVNVGDSRAYRLHNDELTQLTIDHSYVAELVQSGSITPEEAAVHPYRNMVTRSVGINLDLEVDSWGIELTEGDRFLICSDGLFGELADNQIAAFLGRNENPEDAARQLLTAANDHGGRDNISVIVLDVNSNPEAPLTPGEVTGEIMIGNAGLIPHHGEETEIELETESSKDDDLAEVEATMPINPTRPLPARDLLPPLATPSEDQEALEPGTQEKHSSTPTSEKPEPREAATATGLNAPLTWRLLSITIATVLAALLLVGAAGMWARQGKYIGFSGDEAVVYQGRADGLLWIEPTIAAHTGIYRAELPEGLVEDIEANISVESVSEAIGIVAQFARTDGEEPVTE